MKSVKLTDIAKNISTVSKYDGDIYVRGVSIDTRTINKGDIFIAIKGKKYDGHDFIKIAEQKGACAIICSKDVNSKLPILKVKDTVIALQELALYYRKCLNVKVIAVTGSNGKTTTKNMISTVLSSKYRVFSTDRNYNNEIGLPMSIFEVDDNYDIAVLEMGMNHLGEIKKLSDIAKPDIAIITNIGKAHIGNLISQENILRAKLEITSGLSNNGTLILNSDDNFLKDIKSSDFQISFIGCNNSDNNHLSAKNIVSTSNLTSFEVLYQNESFNCNIPIIGKHNVSNALFAISCGIYFDISIKKSIKSLERYISSPMRCEKSLINGVTIIKDYYNSSPESVRCAVELLSDYSTDSKKIAILGQMSELGSESKKEHFNLGRLCYDKRINHTFFIGQDFIHFENGSNKINCTCYDENERMYLLESIRKYIKENRVSHGDVILIKGSRNMRMEEIYEFLKICLESPNNLSNIINKSATKLYVDISAIKYNYLQVQKFIGEKVEILPMVKANAYGAGSNIISNIFQNSKYLAVADIQEARCIKNILPNVNIVIIYQPRFEDIEEIVNMGYIPAVSDINFAKQLDKLSNLQNKITNIHVEINTGHCRLGIDPKDVSIFAKEISKLKNIKVEGIFMHYSSADAYDNSDLEFTNIQTNLFDRAIHDFESIYGNIKYKHACAGAAIFNSKTKLYNMVRPGYILYGYYPNDEIKDKIILKPSLKFTSTILQIRDVDEHTPISYNRRFITKRKSRIATVSIGYSDGLPRKLFNVKNKNNGYFVVNGQRAPIVGNICMDLTMIDITDIEGEIKIGDEVSIFDNSNVTIEEIANICDTIGYEIISQISDKTPRIESF